MRATVGGALRWCEPLAAAAHTCAARSTTGGVVPARSEAIWERVRAARTALIEARRGAVSMLISMPFDTNVSNLTGAECGAYARSASLGEDALIHRKTSASEVDLIITCNSLRQAFSGVSAITTG